MAEGIEYFTDEEGGHRWRARGANGEIVATSEAYTRPEDAARGASDAIEIFAQVAESAGRALLLVALRVDEPEEEIPSRVHALIAAFSTRDRPANTTPLVFAKPTGELTERHLLALEEIFGDDALKTLNVESR